MLLLDYLPHARTLLIKTMDEGVAGVIMAVVAAMIAVAVTKKSLNYIIIISFDSITMHLLMYLFCI